MPVRDPSLNIYWRWFELRHQLSIVPFLFLNPQIVETSIAGADKVRRNLLTIDVNYIDLDDSVDQDDFLLTHPLHQHLFSRLTHPLLSTFLRVAMDNQMTRGVNNTTLPSEILETITTNVAKTSLTPLDDIVSLHLS
jgi:hypothetical protein